MVEQFHQVMSNRLGCVAEAKLTFADTRTIDGD
jgi:hypothetical protein